MKEQESSNSRGRSGPHFVRPERRRTVPLVLALVTGITVSLAISVLVYHWETYGEAERLRSRFLLDAQEVVGAIHQEIDTHLQVLQSLGALFHASEQVTREEFRVFANELLEASRRSIRMEHLGTVIERRTAGVLTLRIDRSALAAFVHHRKNRRAISPTARSNRKHGA